MVGQAMILWDGRTPIPPRWTQEGNKIFNVRECARGFTIQGTVVLVGWHAIDFLSNMFFMYKRDIQLVLADFRVASERFRLGLVSLYEPIIE